MSMIIPYCRTSQPQQVATPINRASPLTRGLKALVVPSLPVDPLRNFAFQVSGATVMNGRAGVGFNSASNVFNRAYAGSLDADKIFNGTECTVFVVRQHTDTTARASAVFGCGNSSSSRVLCHGPYSDGNIYWDFGSSAGTHRLSAAYGGKTTNVETLVLVAGAFKGREIWRNGVKLAGNTGITGTCAVSAADWSVLGTVGIQPEVADLETIYMLGVVQRAWSDAEIALWQRNPWQIFGARTAQQRMALLASRSTGGAAPANRRPRGCMIT